MIIIALAGQAKTDGIAYAEEINGITRDGEKCTDYAACLAHQGRRRPRLRRRLRSAQFNGNGEPLEASYGVLAMGDNNRIDISTTEYVTAKARPSSTSRRCPSRAPATVTAC